ncbi:AraC family transcriptional regulator [Candidatus Stoquefichus sp. SB1]|uniref:AraC family transcriptional regulator n=1 Tax=Candidatus Stoquefichus sp. SB1 TaxID=1658109 RepID=UPI00067F4451|nr:AraC family transcriptional regulator [Candidatus Stoquefichus sp. SB1]
MEYKYEKVKLENKIPAKITYFNRELLNDWKSDRGKKRLPVHWHRSIEITMIMKGAVRLKVVNEEYIIHQNEFVFVNSGLLHTVEETEDSGEIEGLIVVLAYDFMKESYPEIDKYYFDLYKDDTQLDHIRIIFNQLIELYENLDDYAYIKIKALLLDLVYILVKYCAVPINDNHKYKKFLNSKQYVLDYIEENYNEDLSLEKIAKEFAVSPVHFSRVFYKVFGIHYKKYVTDFRLYNAYEDVIGSDKTIQQIALIHGFPNVKSFIRDFQKNYGKTPYQYRMLKKDNFSDN